jgi:hypothetical protein
MVRAQLNCIFAHPLFLHSKRSSALLKFLVTHTLAGESDALHERVIGIEVYGRDAAYDTPLDSTVRVAATEVRRRLALYYSEPEHEHELHIELLRGSYITEFTPSKSAQQTPDGNKEIAVKGKPSRRLLLAFSVLIPLLCFYGGYLWMSTPSAVERFWSPLVSHPVSIPISIGSLNNQIVRGNDKATYSESILKQQPLPEVVSQKMLITTQRDVASAVAISSFLAYHGKASHLQISQNATLKEMKRQPAFLIGSFGNEWAMRLGESLRYTFQKDSASKTTWIQDSTDLSSRTWMVDPSASFSKDRKEYALITRALDQTTGQWWIGVAGLTGLGTVVAQQMILDPNLMTALGNRLPRGWYKKNLQIVLEINIVKESPGTPQIVATYSW